MREPVFRGAATALVTPFCGGEIDFSALDRLLACQLDAHIPALVVTGTTGEASTLSTEEKEALWRHCVGFVGGQAVVIAGVGTNCTQTSAELADLARRCGVDALLAVTPYYNKCTQEGLIAHYTAIAEAGDLPLIAYNVPSRTGVDLRAETCLALSRHPNIVGVKEASGSMSRAAEILHLCGTDFSLWSGNDDVITATMALGGQGVISVLSNVCPKAVVQMTQSALDGDFQTSAALQLRYLPLIRALFSEVNPIPVKAALHECGICGDEVRLPLTRISPQNAAKLKDIKSSLF